MTEQQTKEERVGPYRFYIVKEPGLVPRIGFPIGDIDKSIDEWVQANPTAEIMIVTQHGDRPHPGCLDVQLASEYVTIRNALKDCVFEYEGDDDE